MTPTAARIIYPELPKPLTPSDLYQLFRPSYVEREWVPTIARIPSSQVALLVQLKIFQTIGRFLGAADIPPAAIEYVASHMGVEHVSVLISRTRTFYRHRRAILQHLKDLFGAVAEAASKHQPTLKFSQLELLPVIPNPGQIFCIGLNYGEHVRETGKEITESPAIFLRLLESQVAHGQDILRPAESHRLDFEAEIAIVIGKGGRRIKEEDAWDHIAGYSCYNDGSVRDWQVATSQWTPGKNFYKTGGFGPWLVTSDEIAPGQVMHMQTILNGQVLQDTTTDKMIHSIPRQIAYISTFTPLKPGDVIVTGTPGGVGNKRNPQIFMKPGDVCEIVVDAIGTLRNGIRDDA